MIALVLFADVSLSTEAIVLVTALVVALAGAVGVMFRMLMANHDSRLADQKTQYESRLVEQTARDAARIKGLEDQNRSYREISDEALTALEAKVNELRGEKGRTPFKVLTGVVPEHNSPVTKEQQETADLQTTRARVTAATLALELPPRVGGEPETDEERVVRIAKEAAAALTVAAAATEAAAGAVKGDRGEKGEQGPQGPKGDPGEGVP